MECSAYNADSCINYTNKASVEDSCMQTAIRRPILPAVPSASAWSSRGRCLNFISPKCIMAHVDLYRLIFSSSPKPRTTNACYTSITINSMCAQLVRHNSEKSLFRNQLLQLSKNHPHRFITTNSCDIEQHNRSYAYLMSTLNLTDHCKARKWQTIIVSYKISSFN